MPASDGLRQKIRGELAQAADEDATPVRRRSTAWQKFAIAAAVVAMVSSGTTHYLEQPNEEALWTQGIVKAHERGDVGRPPDRRRLVEPAYGEALVQRPDDRGAFGGRSQRCRLPR